HARFRSPLSRSATCKIRDEPGDEDHRSDERQHAGDSLAPQLRPVFALRLARSEMIARTGCGLQQERIAVAFDAFQNAAGFLLPLRIAVPVTHRRSPGRSFPCQANSTILRAGRTT